jgi:hypothetical protein
MPFVVLIVGAILIIAAFNNTYSKLAAELETDVPGFFKWAAAIAAIVALGYVPGLRVPTRWLLALVMLVLLLKNYSQIYAGFTSFAQSNPAPTGAAVPTPTAGFIANPATTSPPTVGSGGTGPIVGGSVMGGLLSGGINLGSKLFGTGGAANPSTGSNLGLGN